MIKMPLNTYISIIGKRTRLAEYSTDDILNSHYGISSSTICLS